MIELKDSTHIGELCFKGLDENGVAETRKEFLKNAALSRTVKWGKKARVMY